MILVAIIFSIYLFILAYICKCSAQSGNSHFVGRSRNSYFAQCNSGIARAQSGNRDKVRIFIYDIRNKFLISFHNMFLCVIFRKNVQ